jgi:hypothetical protein
MLRIIIWGLIFYLVYKTATRLMRVFIDNAKSEQVEDSSKKAKYDIKKDDIIDAQFEEISSAEENKPKDNV